MATPNNSNIFAIPSDAEMEAKLKKDSKRWEPSLLPCPVCGKKPRLTISCPTFKIPGVMYYFTVECPSKNHFIKAYGDTGSEVVSAWNTRSNDNKSENHDGAIGCPFCGSDAEYRYGGDSLYDPLDSPIKHHIVSCSNCRAGEATRRMVYIRSDTSKTDAIKMWNKRIGKKKHFWQ